MYHPVYINSYEVSYEYWSLESKNLSMTQMSIKHRHHRHAGNKKLDNTWRFCEFLGSFHGVKQINILLKASKACKVKLLNKYLLFLPVFSLPWQDNNFLTIGTDNWLSRPGDQQETKNGIFTIVRVVSKPLRIFQFVSVNVKLKFCYT